MTDEIHNEAKVLTQQKQRVETFGEPLAVK